MRGIRRYAIVYDFAHSKALFVYGLEVLMRCLLLFEGVVGRTDERARLHVTKTHFLSQLLVFGKFLRMDKPHDRKMVPGRLQILAERAVIRTANDVAAPRLHHLIP